MLYDNLYRGDISAMGTVLCTLKPIAVFVACNKKVSTDSTTLMSMDIGASIIEGLFLIIGNKVW